MSNVVERDTTDDPEGLRQHWLGLKAPTTSIRLLRKYQLSRLGALRAVGPDLAQEGRQRHLRDHAAGVG